MERKEDSRQSKLAKRVVEESARYTMGARVQPVVVRGAGGGGKGKRYIVAGNWRLAPRIGKRLVERGTRRRRRRRLRGGERKWVEGGGKSGVAPCETSRRSFAPRPARVYRECSNVCIARRVLHRTGSRAHSYGHFVAVYFGKFPVSTSTILLLFPPLCRPREWFRLNGLRGI